MFQCRLPPGCIPGHGGVACTTCTVGKVSLGGPATAETTCGSCPEGYNTTGEGQSECLGKTVLVLMHPLPLAFFTASAYKLGFWSTHIKRWSHTCLWAQNSKQGYDIGVSDLLMILFRTVTDATSNVFPSSLPPPVCNPGYGSVDGNSLCTKCPAGTFSPGGVQGQVNCTSCPANSATAVATEGNAACGASWQHHTLRRLGVCHLR